MVFMSKNKKKKRIVDVKWVIEIIIFTFFISMLFSFASDKVISNSTVVLSILVLLFFILLGILFDIIGVAVTASDESPFHAMAAKKIKSARLAIDLKKNSSKVASFCNDVIGDICGVVSGSCGVAIALKLSEINHWNLALVTLIITAIISSLTIGGKAIGKGFAIKRATNIHLKVAKVMSFFSK